MTRKKPFHVMVLLQDNKNRLHQAARVLGSLALALVLMVTIVGLFSGLAATSVAEEQGDADSEGFVPEKPLYEQDEYDLITLKHKQDEPPLKVEPLKLPGRRVPKYAGPSFRVRIILCDEPEKKFDLRWSAVEKVEFFEDLVLKKAIELVQQGEREKAYDYFSWLLRRDSKWPGLREAIGDYLYREAGVQLRKKDYYGALAILMNLYDHDPEYPRLPKALEMTEDKLLKKCDAQRDYSTARALLKNLRDRFPDHPTVRKWESDLQGRALRHLATARDAAGQGKYRKADRAMQEVVLLWPDLPGAKQMLKLLHRRYPRVVVGVSSPTINIDPRHRRDWATRRSTRLVYRTLTEFLGPGSEGGDYRCPVGQIEIEPLQRRMILQIRPGLQWAHGEATLNGIDVARQLLAMAEPSSDQYESAWSELFGGATVKNVYQVNVEMKRPHVRPDALLQTALSPCGATSKAGQLAPFNGPYLVDKKNKNEDEMVYISSPQYFDATATQPKEIVEQQIGDDRKSQYNAIRALRDGRMKVIDRLYPWTLSEFRSMPNVVVEPYAAPLVHCLIPNRKRRIMANDVFRRALVYGIHRQVILKHLLGGKEIEGCGLISGPFPRGVSYDDPLGYAYDTDIEPRPYEPGLAVMLATYVADTMTSEKEKKAAENGQTKKEADKKPASEEGNDKKRDKKDKKKVERKILVKITLAYPPNEIARVACQKIKEQLKIVGIEVKLRELPPGPIERIPDDVDLLYAELPMWEPVVDSRELLSADGPSGEASVYMGLVMRQLRRATDWRKVRPILHQIHRVAHNDVAVIPLWQLVDHFAYHTSLKGIGVRPVTLYENVEQWELDVPVPSKPDGNDGASLPPSVESRHLANIRIMHPILPHTSSETK